MRHLKYPQRKPKSTRSQQTTALQPIEPLAAARLRLDYAAWRSQIRGATGVRPVAQFDPSGRPMVTLIFENWLNLLRSANADTTVGQVAPVADVAEFPVANPDLQRAA